MPELPDLEVFSYNLNRQLVGRKLDEIKFKSGLKLNVSRNAIKKGLTNQVLKKVYREGKELRMAFGNRNILGLHLMLRGKLFWFDGKNPPAHMLASLSFDHGKNLALTDYQKRARLMLNPESSGVPDALSDGFNFSYLVDECKSRASVKNLLTDQNIVRGIGNAYADEILWKSGISPFSQTDKIPKEKIKTLHRSIRSVLKRAINQIRKAEPGIIGGEVRDFMAVHNPKKKKSPTGAPIKSTGGTRKTYYTSEQKIYK